MKITEWVFLYMKYDWPISKYFDGTFCWLWTSYFWRVFCLQWKVYIDIFFSSNTTPTSPLLEEAGCGLLNALGSSSSPTFSSSLKLLVGSRHHFDLVSIDLSQNGNSDSTRILTLASGSSTGAISATEVSKFTILYLLVTISKYYRGHSQSMSCTFLRFLTPPSPHVTHFTK